MAQVRIEVGGHSYDVGCKDGEEDHIRKVARLADEKAQEAMKSVGRTGEVRTLLFATILLADELQDVRAKLAATGTTPTVDDATMRNVESLANRAEALAAKLEKALVTA